MKDHDLTFSFIIGGQRCGSSFLCQILNSHNSICLANPIFPEPKYFLQDDINKEIYLKKFYSHRTNETVLLEKSTSYYEIPEVAKKIQLFDPNAKLICILRDPVERALSNYFFSVQNGLESRSLEEVFIHEISISNKVTKLSVDPFNYFERGEYYKHLMPYFETFGSEKILILQFEQLLQDKGSLNLILEFLKIPNNNLKIPDQKVNFGTAKTSVSTTIRKKLSRYYSEHNKRLNNYNNIDLSLWL